MVKLAVQVAAGAVAAQAVLPEQEMKVVILPQKAIMEVPVQLIQDILEEAVADTMLSEVIQQELQQAELEVLDQQSLFQELQQHMLEAAEAAVEMVAAAQAVLVAAGTATGGTGTPTMSMGRMAPMGLAAAVAATVLAATVWS